MSIANQNPDDLPDFLTMINQLQADGVRTDPDFFRSIAKAGGDFKAPDEDLGSFFKRIFEPVRNNAKVDPEGFNRDSHGSIWATLMGDNAMDRAHDRLDTTDVYDGYTAGDLIRGQYNTDTSKPYGDSTVTFDYGKLGDAKYDAAQARRGEKDLTVYDANALVKIFTDTTATKWDEMKAAAVDAGGKESDISEDDAKRAAAAEIYQDYPMFADKISQIGTISKWYSPSEGEGSPTEPSGAPTGLLTFGGTPGTSDAPTAPVAPPTVSVDAPVPGAIPLPGGWQAKDNGDGTSTLFKGGVAVAKIANEKLKQSVPQTGAVAPIDASEIQNILNNPTGN
jgi:hypothetical protein